MKMNLLVGWGESLTRVKIDPKCILQLSSIKITSCQVIIGQYILSYWYMLIFLLCHRSPIFKKIKGLEHLQWELFHHSPPTWHTWNSSSFSFLWLESANMENHCFRKGCPWKLFYGTIQYNNSWMSSSKHLPFLIE
jgi:hypothetical protein